MNTICLRRKRFTHFYRFSISFRAISMLYKPFHKAKRALACPVLRTGVTSPLWGRRFVRACTHGASRPNLRFVSAPTRPFVVPCKSSRALRARKGRAPSLPLWGTQARQRGKEMHAIFCPCKSKICTSTASTCKPLAKPRFVREGKLKSIYRNITTVLPSKTVLSGEVFKESFTDIFQTSLEQVAFSLESDKKSCTQYSKASFCSTVAQRRPFLATPGPKNSISLNVKVGDYLSSGDKIGEKSFQEKSCFTVLSFFVKSTPISNSCGTKRWAISGITNSSLPHAHTRACGVLAPLVHARACPKRGKKVLGRAPKVQARTHDTRSRSFVFSRGKGFVNRKFACPFGARPCVPPKGQEGARAGARPCVREALSKICKASGKGLQIKDLYGKRQGIYTFSAHASCRGVRVINFLALTNLFTCCTKGASKRLHRRCTPFANRSAPFVKSNAGRLYLQASRSCSARVKIKRQSKNQEPNFTSTNYTPLKLKGKPTAYSFKQRATPVILTSSGRVLTISKTQLIVQKTQPILFYNSANLHVKKGEWVQEGKPILTLTHQTLITGDIVQGIPRIEQLFEAFTSPPVASGLKDKQTVTKFKDVHDTLHSQVRDIFRKHWLKSRLPIAVRKSLEEIGYILVEMIQKVYLSQGVLIADKHIEIIIRQIASKGQILDSGTTGLFLEEVLPIRQIENANLTTPGKKCLYVPAVMGLTAAALNSDSFISAASFQETTRVLSRDAVVGKSDFLRGLKEKVVIGDLISAGTGLDIYFIYTTMLAPF